MKRLFALTSLRIEPFPFFYADYLAIDEHKLTEWEFANDQDRIINNDPIWIVNRIDLINDIMLDCKTKIFDDELESLIRKLVRSFIDMMSFSLQFLPNNRIMLQYITDRTISDEIYSHKIKNNLRDVKKKVTSEINNRLIGGEDDWIVSSTPIQVSNQFLP